MIKIENAQTSLYDFLDFSFTSIGLKKQRRVFLCFLFLFFFTLYFFRETIFSENFSQAKSVVAFLFFALLALIVFLGLVAINLISIFNSYKRKPSTIEFRDGLLYEESPGSKTTLPKELMKKIIFAKKAVYIFYYNKAFVIVKRFFNSDLEWNEAVAFIKEKYVSSETDVKEV